MPTTRSASLRVAHARSCPNASRSALDSAGDGSGCTCQPSYYTHHRDVSGHPLKGPRVRDRQTAERALRKLAVAIDEGRVGVGRPDTTTTFRQWADGYEAILEGNGRRASTIRAYRPTLKYGRDVIGSLPLRAIGNDELRRFVRALREAATGTRPSRSTFGTCPPCCRRPSRTASSTPTRCRGSNGGSSFAFRAAPVLHGRGARETVGADGGTQLPGRLRGRVPVRDRDRRSRRRVDRARLAGRRPLKPAHPDSPHLGRLRRAHAPKTTRKGLSTSSRPRWRSWSVGWPSRAPTRTARCSRPPAGRAAKARRLVKVLERARVKAGIPKQDENGRPASRSTRSGPRLRASHASTA